MNESQRWYYAVEDQTHGPVDDLELRRLIQDGVIFSSTWIAFEGTENWLPAKDSAFADEFVAAPSAETLPNALESDVSEPQNPGSPGYSRAHGPSRPTGESFSTLIGGWLPVVRRRWQMLVPGLLGLVSFVLLLHHFRHWQLFRRDQPPSSVQSISTPVSTLAPTPPISTPPPHLDANALRSEYQNLVANKDNTKAFSDWEKEMAAHLASKKSDEGLQWINFRNYLGHLNSMILPSELEVVQQLGRKEYEARFYNPFQPGETFVLLTTVNNFAGPGRGSLPIRHIGTRTMSLKNGFEKTAEVYREVTQDEPDDAWTALRNVALSFSACIRAFPPDDATLERYIADTNQSRANRLIDKDGQPHYEGATLEDNVLYVCLQTRLRNEIQPIDSPEAVSTTVKPMASASPTPSSSRSRSGSRVEAARPSISPLPTAPLAASGSGPDTRSSPSPSPPAHLARPGTFFLLQYVSVKNERGVYGFEPGQEVHLVRSSPDKGTMVVSDGKCELEVAASQLTNDLDMAAQLARADTATQARIVSRLRSEKSAAEARQHELDIARARNVEAAEKQRTENSQVRATPNPLDQ